MTEPRRLKDAVWHGWKRELWRYLAGVVGFMAAAMPTDSIAFGTIGAAICYLSAYVLDSRLH